MVESLVLRSRTNVIGADRWVTWRRPCKYLNHKWQRMTRGHSEYDIIDLESFLADTIAATAWGLFANGKSFPMDLTEGQWLDVLLEIYDGFSRRNEDDELDIPDMAWVLLRRRFNDLWS